jgi:hypothetical protein
MEASLNNIENSQCQPNEEGLVAPRQVFGMNAKDGQKQEKAQHTQAKDACQG